MTEMSDNNNPYMSVKTTLEDSDCEYFDLSQLNDPRFDSLPFSIRVLLEAAVRNCDNFEVHQKDVETILDWQNTQAREEIAHKPARVLLQDFTGVPCVADLAAMRDAVRDLGGDPAKINPLIPTDLVIDHSVVADQFGVPDARDINEKLEFARNRERFAFLKWGQYAFKNMTITPPGSGIVHQVNLEFLGRVVMKNGKMLYPDSLVGTDSHTTMICGLGVVAWGVGGIEAEAVMLGQPISMVLPAVVGFKMTGEMQPMCTATDLVLTVTKILREQKVVGKFVEFFGEGCGTLTVADRATISNMSPEYGATMGFFPIDAKTIEYLRQTGRNEEDLNLFERYLRKQKLFRTYDAEGDFPIKYSGKVIELDLSTVVPSVAGPKRPQDRVSVTDLKKEFVEELSKPVSFKAFGVPKEKLDTKVTITVDKQEYVLSHGSVVVAAITSCTNTSNPMVLVGAGLMAKNAVERGLKVPKFVKTTLSPGSRVVMKYLESAELVKPLEELGFYLAGFGCMTCIGNSGDLPEAVGSAVTANDLVVASVLSGNRNFEGRVHPLTRANYLTSPMLVVAYALAGTVIIDFEKEPIGKDQSNNDVFLRDIWPARELILEIVEKNHKPEMYQEVYSVITEGSCEWQQTKVPEGDFYSWSPESTYIHKPPFFESIQPTPPQVDNIDKAYCLLNLGDSITTDHISPAGKIALKSPAALYLEGRKVPPKEFNSLGSRRGNDEVMIRGTFANIRLVNKMVPNPGPYTVHVPSGQKDFVYNVAMKYKQEGVPTIILAGQEYGCGSSRDWAAKGVLLQGVRAVIARSFEKIHRSNLVGMGVLPLEFMGNDSAESLGLTGSERFSIDLQEGRLTTGQNVKVQVFDSKSTNMIKEFMCKCRIDSTVEIEYFKHGGILPYVLRKICACS